MAGACYERRPLLVAQSHQRVEYLRHSPLAPKKTQHHNVGGLGRFQDLLLPVLFSGTAGQVGRIEGLYLREICREPLQGPVSG